MVKLRLLFGATSRYMGRLDGMYVYQWANMRATLWAKLFPLDNTPRSSCKLVPKNLHNLFKNYTAY